MTRQFPCRTNHMTQSLLACHSVCGRGFTCWPIANASVFVLAVVVPGSKHSLVKNKSCVTNFPACSSVKLALFRFSSPIILFLLGAQCRWRWRPTCWGRTRRSRRSAGLRWTTTYRPASSTSAGRRRRCSPPWRAAASACSTEVRGAVNTHRCSTQDQ